MVNSLVEQSLLNDLKNGGVNLGLDSANSEIKDAVAKAKADIIDGKITVPSK